MYELTVAVPTLNERDNIVPLLAKLDAALAGVAWEVVFVDDDSRDGTADLIRQISRDRPNVRVIQRVGRRGLASACVEGIMSSHAPFVAVMDADLQHDERLLPRMLDALRPGTLDIVVGSRYVDGGGLGDWSAGRRLVSRIATRLADLAFKVPLKDPMSGFFMLSTEFAHDTVRRMSGRGFKILLDLFLSASRPPRFLELPYRFGVRQAGASKLDLTVSLDYLYLLADKLIGHIVPVRFLLFVAVGCTGVITHLATLWLFHKLIGVPFLAAQMMATLTAMTGNFFLNNRITYRDRRLHGWDLLRGLVSFTLVCTLGAVGNFYVAEWLFEAGIPWAMAGILGALVGAVWNYGVSSTFTWRQSRRARVPEPTPVPARPEA